jgi:hypothetical protein
LKDDASVSQNTRMLENKGVKIDGEKYKRKIISDTGLSTQIFDQLGAYVYKNDKFIKVNI